MLKSSSNKTVLSVVELKCFGFMVTDRKAPKSMLDRNKLVRPAIILCTSVYKVQLSQLCTMQWRMWGGLWSENIPWKTEMTLWWMLCSQWLCSRLQSETSFHWAPEDGLKETYYWSILQESQPDCACRWEASNYTKCGNAFHAISVFVNHEWAHMGKTSYECV